MAAALALTQIVRGVCKRCVRIRAKHHAGRHGPVSPCEHSQAALTARQARAAAAAQRTSGPEPCALSVRAVAPLGSCFAVFARPARTATQRLSAAALLGQVRHCSGVVVCATRAESADSVRSVRCDTAGAAAPQPQVRSVDSNGHFVTAHRAQPWPFRVTQATRRERLLAPKICAH